MITQDRESHCFLSAMAPKHNSSSSSSSSSSSKTKTKYQKKSCITKKQKKQKKSKEEQIASSTPTKRNPSPGVRVINGRIYDSQNGKCCHQCRQKTCNFSLRCKNQTEDKQCNCYFCHICLLNRYGEKAEEMASLGDWKCPKCRNICNCSICRKKQGGCPTGNILHVAKSKGYASVYEMLQSEDYKKDVIMETHGKENSSTGKSSSHCFLSPMAPKHNSSSASKIKTKSQKKSCITTNQKKQKNSNEEQNASSPTKRNRSPGVRVINGRIYDSQNGKCCHQCRQKTCDFSLRCKNQTEDKQCSCYFCHICLLNRYGEKAEEMAALGDWKCPKCRNICNCSICRKKQGGCPIGNIIRVVKSKGFASVYEMLQSEDYKKDVIMGTHRKENGSNGTSSSKSKCKSKGHHGKDRLSGTIRVTKNKRAMKDTGTIIKSTTRSSTDPVSFKKVQQDIAIASIRGRQSGSILNGENGRILNFEVVQLGKNMENCELRKGKRRGNLSERNKKYHITEEKHISKEKVCTGEWGGKSKKRKLDISDTTEKCKMQKKIKNGEMVITCEDKIEEKASGKDDGDQSANKTMDMKNTEEKSQMKYKEEDINVVDIIQSDNEGEQVDLFGKHQYNSEKIRGDDYDAGTAMPRGVELTKVAKIDFAAEDVGHALQFLQFCDAFGKVLDIKKGQPECLLRELASGQCSNHVGDSSIFGFHIRLLSIIQKKLVEEYSSLGCDSISSWLLALSRYISDSRCQPKDLLRDQLDVLCEKYVTFSSSKKLRILTFLCDEALSSVELRNWMNETNLEYDEEERKEKENERKKEKEVKMKLQNELARAVLANKGAPLSVSEHQDLVSKIKAEAAHTLADLATKKNQKSEAIRSEPMLLDGDGSKFWKLKGHSSENVILLQDIGSGKTATSTERWFSFTIEEEAIITNYVLGKLRN